MKVKLMRAMLKHAKLMVSSLLLCLSANVAAADKPNLIVILTDDQGYADVGFNGSKEIFTPNIDRIASEGARLEVEYNVRGRDVDRLALVMYGMDGNKKWHIFGTHTDAAGKIIYSVPIEDNSRERPLSLRLSTSQVFNRSDGIWRIVYTLSKLKPGQTTVPLEPSAHFALP